MDTKDMIPLEPYYASDRRVYNGAPCSDIDKEWKHTDNLVEKLDKLSPGARATYFPGEDKYLVFHQVPSKLWPDETTPKELTGNMHYDKQEALIEAIEFLRAKGLKENHE